MFHVDLMKHDWVTGRPILAARAWVQDGTVTVKSYLGDEWRRVLESPVTDPETGTPIDPASSPDVYLKQLHRAVNNSYWSVTEPHNTDECAFDDEQSPVAVTSTVI